MRDDVGEIVQKFVVATEEEQRGARGPGRRALSFWTKVFILLAVFIAIASAALGAFVLMTQQPTFTHTGALSGCPTPTGAASGSLITYTCTGGTPSIIVASSATSFVTYSSFSVPTANVTDVYLVDTLATAAASCSAWTTTGATNVLLTTAGSSITIGTGAGKLAPGHNYDYCLDILSEPPSFSFTITWTQH